MTPVGVFFICQNEDKCHFVNSTTFDPEHEKSRQGWTVTMENLPNKPCQKAQIGAEMTPICP